MIVLMPLIFQIIICAIAPASSNQVDSTGSTVKAVGSKDLKINNYGRFNMVNGLYYFMIK